MPYLKKSAIEELFIKHKNVCPYCKCSSEKTWDEGDWRRCSCNGKWKPNQPTKENLKEFEEFIREISHIFT